MYLRVVAHIILSHYVIYVSCQSARSYCLKPQGPVTAVCLLSEGSCMSENWLLHPRKHCTFLWIFIPATCMPTVVSICNLAAITCSEVNSYTRFLRGKNVSICNLPTITCSEVNSYRRFLRGKKWFLFVTSLPSLVPKWIHIRGSCVVKNGFYL